MTRHEPFSEELELPHQQLAIVGRKLLRLGGIARLHAHERIDGIRVERLRIRTLSDGLQVVMTAEVADQDEPLLRVHREDRRHVHAGCREDARNAQPRIEAFPLGRRVHRDLRGTAAMNAEVATEARVGGCRRDAINRRPGQASDPSFEFLQPRIGVVVCRHAEATAGVPAL